MENSAHAVLMLILGVVTAFLAFYLWRHWRAERAYAAGA